MNRGTGFYAERLIPIAVAPSANRRRLLPIVNSIITKCGRVQSSIILKAYYYIYNMLSSVERTELQLPRMVSERSRHVHINR
jgi:hypothetical protein